MSQERPGPNARQGISKDMLFGDSSDDEKDEPAAVTQAVLDDLDMSDSDMGSVNDEEMPAANGGVVTAAEEDLRLTDDSSNGDSSSGSSDSDSDGDGDGASYESG